MVQVIYRIFRMYALTTFYIGLSRNSTEKFLLEKTKENMEEERANADTI
jgi:amino acid permease